MISKNSSPGQSHLLETASTTETAAPPYDPPEYTPQSQFPVGRAVTTAPFVTPSQIKIHLGLLRAFRELKLKVQATSDVADAFPPLAGALEPEARWVWFLELALERYAIHRLSPFRFRNELGIVSQISKMGFSSRCIACVADRRGQPTPRRLAHMARIYAQSAVRIALRLP
jgi:hypothetical protein